MTEEKLHEKTAMYLLPCKPGVCQECAVDHAKDFPHDANSLYYQYHFLAEHGRWPTWKDALAHCTEDMRRRSTSVLLKMGVEVTDE